MAHLSLTRARRLRRPGDFLRVRREGVAISSAVAKIAVRPAKEQRMAVITSRELGGAVVRNRLRRRIREHFRLHRGRYPHGDCIVILRTKAAGLSTAVLWQAVDELLSRLQQKLQKENREQEA